MENKKIGIICAMPVEFDAITEKIRDKAEKYAGNIKVLNGKIGTNEVFLTLNGMGKVSAAMCAEALILAFSPDAVINCGVAGSLTDSLGVLDVAIADFCVQHDMDTTAIGDPRGFISGLNMVKIPCDAALVSEIENSARGLDSRIVTGTIASGDRFVADKEEKEDIASFFGAIACEMEGCAVAQVCYMNKVPCGVIRVISDSPENPSAMDYEKFKPIAASLAAKILYGILTK